MAEKRKAPANFTLQVLFYFSLPDIYQPLYGKKLSREYKFPVSD
jgi:hypothetical protein